MSYPGDGGFRSTDSGDWHRASQPGSSRFWIILLLVGGGAMFLLCCGGLGGVAFFGLNLVAREIETELRDNPVIVEHIGEIEEFDVDWTGSFAAEDDIFVFDVRGSKGSGEITAESITNDDGDEDVVSGSLRMKDGTTFDLFPESEL